MSRLSTEAASGNNATLFDHRADGAPDPLTPAAAARALLASQAFALGFGRSASARIYGVEHPRPYSADAILLRGLTLWLSGSNLFETLLLNYSEYVRHSDDLPAWEQSPPHSLMDRVDGSKRVCHGVRGRLDRLTWQSRLVRLLPEVDAEGNTVVRHVYFTQGRSAEKAGHPLKTYRKVENQGFLPVSLSPSRAAWRDAHALLELRTTPGEETAAALLWASRMKRLGVLDKSHTLGLNVVGLATAPNKAGKFLMWRQEQLPLPAVLLSDESEALLGEVKKALEHARKQASGMRVRMARVAKLYLAPDMDRAGCRQPDAKEVTRLVESVDPTRAYWPRLEAPFHQFLSSLSSDPTAAAEQWDREVNFQQRKALTEAQQALGNTPRVQAAVAREAAERKRFAEQKQRERAAQQGAAK